MIKWLRQNLITLLITVIITSSFGYIITQTDAIKTNYMALAVSTTKEITCVQEKTDNTQKELDEFEKMSEERWCRIETKLDQLLSVNKAGNDNLRKLTFEIKGIANGETKIDVK